MNEARRAPLIPEKVKLPLIAACALLLGVSLSTLLVRRASGPVVPLVVAGDYTNITQRYSGDLLLFTETGCPYSQAAKKYLAERRITYKEISVDEGMDDRAYFTGEMGQSSVPVLLSTTWMLVGYDRAGYDAKLRIHSRSR